MGYQRRLKDNELVGGTSDKYVYPITSSTAVYHDGKPLSDKLVEMEKEITGSGMIVNNKDAILEYGKKITLATVAGMNITVNTPEKPNTEVINNDVVLEYNKKKTICNIGGKDVTLTMPDGGKADVVNKDIVLEYNKKSTIATIDGKDITVTMPEETIPDTVFISVNSWSEFVAAYDKYAGKKTNVELSLASDIKTESSKTFDLTNFVIHGHYHKWTNNHTTTLTGTYAKFEGVFFTQGSSSSLKLFSLEGTEGTSAEYSFERCRFTDFFKGDTIKLMSLSNNRRYTHVVISMCKFNNTSTNKASQCTILFDETGEPNSYHVSLTIVSSLNSTRDVECYKFAMTHNWASSQLGQYDFLVYDNSMTYSSGYSKPQNYRNISIARS